MKELTLKDLHPSLQEWPAHVPTDARLEIHIGETPTDFWEATEYYDKDGTLLSRSAHVRIKEGLVSKQIQGEF